jgi:two-component system response regulator QseB
MIDARPRLLYVEDDADIAEMTLEVLGETYAVDHVSDGDVALRRALDERYDVMLVDRRLPGMDGARLVEAVRTARITTPVLMLTALGAVPDRVEGLDAGANDYLTKPFDFDELLARPARCAAASRRRAVAGPSASGRSSPTLVLHSPTGARVSPTATEAAFPEFLSASPERVFSREEILRESSPRRTASAPSTPMCTTSGARPRPR